MAVRYPQRRRRDAIDDLSKLKDRARALETGAHPTRNLGAPGATTPWFTLARGAGWTGTVQWRIASNVVQLRGELTGPAGWATGALAATLPADALPSWPMTLVGLSGAGKPIRVLLEVSGQLKPYRDDAGSVIVVIDPLRFPRG